MEDNGLKWRIGLLTVIIAVMIFAIQGMLLTGSNLADKGRADLTGKLSAQNRIVTLNGQWEFYWNRQLMPEDFIGKVPPRMDSLITVPGSWDQKREVAGSYPSNGIATYRLKFSYPESLKDPAVRIKNISSAYKLYANGKLITEVGTVSLDPSHFKEAEGAVILDLPSNSSKIDLLIQVANLNYAKGGLRESLLFGSKKALENHRLQFLCIQLFFIGSVMVFGIYYFLLFCLQTKNKSALLFSMLCLITALRSLIWGEAPLEILLPEISYIARVYINYLTGYNLLPVFVLFIASIYPKETSKWSMMSVLIPSLLFNLLLVTPTAFMSTFTDYLYILILIQMIYVLIIAGKAVLCKRDDAVIMFISICIFILAIIQDILHYKGLGGINVSYMFLYGNFAVIITMCFVQAKQQAASYQKLLRYNESLIEADHLKDKIMETEMSFLQAQIKPHFLYNALNAIANVCEKDGGKAGRLILDLAVYLRGSLEFNNLDKMAPLERQLEFVDTYFHIEQARFGEKIQLKKEVEVPLDYQIPVLILQPLVENAVQHGISKKSVGGTVTIRMKQARDSILIEIEDDGIGISDEKQADLLRDGRPDRGVGLLNIHHRLQRLYGRGLEISSTVGTGTVIRLVLPDRRKKI